jgi:uncharacterized membrane protein YdjX (TVP38/TMEM64 family)
MGRPVRDRRPGAAPDRRASERSRWLRPLAVTIAVLLVGLLVVIFRDPLTDSLVRAYHLLLDREKTEALVHHAGHWGPLVFMAVQLLQVILAPIPGEATGFVGGYLFGATQGFVYSSISLAVGSWINFLIGRFLGRRFIRRVIPVAKLQRMDQMITHQGALVVLLLFVFPGFPKDYLCLFLGVTAMPLKLFLIMAAFGRMPGTLMLSLQGAMLFERMYGVFAFILGMCGLGVYLAYRHRERLYRWIEKMENSNASRR